MKSKDISKNIPQHFAQIIEILSVTVKVCNENNIQVFLIGALARDIILRYWHNIDKDWLATADIDLAINIDGWDNYKKLKDVLIGEYQFIEDSKISHRLYYKKNIAIDIIPYGEIAEENNLVSFPPKFTRKLSVIGFTEVYNYTECLKLSTEPQLEMNVASLPGLVILKLFSWDEKYPERKHDATDIGIILKNYIEAGNFERFIGSDFINEEDFDYDIGTARLLGRDIKNICSEKTLSALLRILERRKDFFANEVGISKNIDTSINIIDGLILGLNE